MAGPLSHIRVLDLTRVLAGPWATQNLGDLGAEVIKIERPEVGDDTRGYGPPFMQDANGQKLSDAVYFLCTNRNKKSVTLDIASPQGQDIIKKLAASCDVLVENYKVGTLKRYGLSYEDLKLINPKIIYCSLTGFGQDGPYSARPGYDILFQGMSGLMSITGEPDGAPGAGPQKVGIAIADVLAGMYTALSVTAAIAHRERTGEGQYIDIALLDTMVAFTTSAGLNWFEAGVVQKRWGTAHPQIAPYEVFEAADGHLVLAIGSDSQFDSFCQVCGCPELAIDERFKRNAGRVQNRAELIPTIRSILKRHSRREWQVIFDRAGVPCGPINEMPEVYEEPQVKHRGLAFELPHAKAGTVHSIANPMRLSLTPVSYRSGPPTLGEHTEAVMRDLLQLPEAEIMRLREEKVI